MLYIKELGFLVYGKRENLGRAAWQIEIVPLRMTKWLGTKISFTEKEESGTIRYRIEGPSQIIQLTHFSVKELLTSNRIACSSRAVSHHKRYQIGTWSTAALALDPSPAKVNLETRPEYQSSEVVHCKKAHGHLASETA